MPRADLLLALRTCNDALADIAQAGPIASAASLDAISEKSCAGRCARRWLVTGVLYAHPTCTTSLRW